MTDLNNFQNFNFNFTQRPEYDLHESLITEVITHYGIPIKFIKTEKINKDNVVFGDFSHIKTNSEDVFDMYALPENSEGFDSSSYNFTEYGFFNFDNINIFVTRRDMDRVKCDLTNTISNLVVFPNNKVMEITNVEFMVPGVNNLFTYKDQKSVYKLTLIPYETKLTDEIKEKDLYNEFKQTDNMKFTPTRDQLDPEPDLYPDFEKEFEEPLDDPEIAEIEKEAKKKNNYDHLDGFFDEIINRKERQDYDSEIKAYSKKTEENSKPEENPETSDDPEIQVEVSVYNKDDPDVWNGV